MSRVVVAVSQCYYGVNLKVQVQSYPYGHNRMIRFYHNACCRGASHAVACAYRLNAEPVDCSHVVSQQWTLGAGKAFDRKWCTSPA